MNIKKKQFAILYFLLYMSVFVGCSLSEEPTETLTPTTFRKTPPSLPTQTSTIEVSEKLSTITPFPTPTEILPTLTETVLPTFSSNQAQETIMSWLENNNGCRFPCIWGLTPGETETQTRKKLLERFGSGQDYQVSISDPSKNPGAIGYSFTTDDNLQISVSLNYFEKGGILDQLSLVTWSARENIPTFGETQYNELLHYYSLNHLLVNYGRPSSVLVAAWPHDPFIKAPFDPFIVVVIYQDGGIVAEYITPSERINDKVHGCPSQSRITISTYSPEEDLSIQDIASIAAGVEFKKSSVEYFKPLEEVTSMTLDDFYDSYKVTNETTCLDILDLWKP